MNKPALSVIIPCYNSEKYIRATLESIFVQQTAIYEIIVIDDASTDNTPAILKSFPQIRYYQQQNQGPSVARNYGLQLAQSDLICFLDHDDVLAANKFEIQLRFLAQNPDVDIVMGKSKYFKDDDLNDPAHESHFSVLLGACIFRKAVFTKVGLFEADNWYCQDFDWFLKAFEKNIPIIRHDDLMFYHRLHETNLSNRRPQARLDILKMLKQSIDRRKELENSFVYPALNG
ncbi:glycosyltransferase family 2 protein [Emticicia sp. 17c]|uniref:glycosyltransferase family 2 protein n=1 Tax=Emticicia sp. 17c TaxID=3127704 RepID=UPI00301E2CAD